MLIYVPLEHIESRYTAHLDADIERFLVAEGINYLKITPPYKAPKKLPDGHFLAAANTIKNKAQQLDQIAGLYESGAVTNDTKFFFSDLWFPGIESLAYLNYFYKVKPKITGIIHAGSFTDTDFVRDMERWAKNFEDIVFDISDTIYCGSNFIKKDIVKKRLVNEKKLLVTGLPLDSNLSKYNTTKKENIVIFNGRMCDEKQPWLFKRMQRDLMVGNWKFICTMEHNYTKEEYYQLLAKSRIVVSFALQENFGFGVAEAVQLGCVPVVPNRCVYPELYSSAYIYSTYTEALVKVRSAMDGTLAVPELYFRSPFNEWFQ